MAWCGFVAVVETRRELPGRGAGARLFLPVCARATGGRRLHGVRPSSGPGPLYCGSESRALVVFFRPRADRSARSDPRPSPSNCSDGGLRAVALAGPFCSGCLPGAIADYGRGRGAHRNDLLRSGPTPWSRLPAVDATRPGERGVPRPRPDGFPVAAQGKINDHFYCAPYTKNPRNHISICRNEIRHSTLTACNYT